MNEEIFAALDQLEKEKGIPKDYMVEKITQALLAAYKKNSTGYTDNVFIDGSGSAMRMTTAGIFPLEKSFCTFFSAMVTSPRAAG